MSILADVARIAGVSKSTASRALSGRGYVSEDTRLKVEQAAAELGYVVSTAAASLVTGRTRNVGVVIPYINRWYFGEVLEGIEASLIQAGYDLTLYRLSSDADLRRRVFDYFLVRKRVDAVISVAIALSPHEVHMLQALGKPLVGIGGLIPGIPSLSIDDVETARLATEHLISLGHRRIMHIGGDQHEQMDFRVHSQRYVGFERALREAGITLEDGFRDAEFSIQGGHAAGLAVLGDPRTRPTAIFAGCDEIAIGIMVAARQLGIAIPQELSVIGIDGHPLAETFGLTTVVQQPGDQGARAVELLLGQLDATPEAPPSEHIVLPTTLSVRTSTAARRESPVTTG
ncbi:MULTISPECIES: LacI family DNA-binding transcriptional regulator [unclassified Microcella]|uniref:LacI family DNA-binding transcriptional regulator n=1 Tax=unclassified Microcella TaxID=2630066 RepID=UPI0006F9A4F1|nr:MULTISPECIES: LacI family DNA-binding transcriptional regulator [unclassified Microcella]KQV25670.1 LacI family transcriptional regulator [Yonghaparkia sp. Root332]KRF33521.1 LacI family transcriptional regulator [Yonghaparkia sp. Soil809]